MPRFLCLRLGQADAGDLRVAIGAARDVLWVHCVRVEPCDGLRRDHAFMARLVRQPGRRGDVADRPEPRHVGSAHRVGLQEPAVHLDTKRLQPDIFGIGYDANRDDNMAELFDRDLAIGGLDLGLDAAARIGDRLNAGCGADIDALLDQRLVQEDRDIGVLDGHDAVEHFDDGYLRAHVVVEACKLDPDRARPDDEQLGRHLGRYHRVPVCPDALAVGLGERQVAGARAGRNDDVLGRQLGRRAVVGHGQRGRRRQRAIAHVHGDLVLFHQVRDALVELLCDTARPLHHRVQIGGRGPLDLQAVILGVLHIVQHFCRPQQRLGRDAPPVEADAAEVLALDNGRLEPELRCTDGGDIAAGAGAEDDEVVGFRQEKLLLTPLPLRERGRQVFTPPTPAGSPPGP